MAETRELNLDEMAAVSGGDEKPKEWITYCVVDGDTLRGIAQRYMCTIKELMEWNRLTNNVLIPGMALNIYTINY